MNHKKLAALALALLCAVPMMTACGKGSKERPTISEEDMPYGSTMREDKNSFAVPLTYDRRFLEQDELAKAADLFAAIQNNDAALYAKTTFPFYLKYQQEQVYKLDSPDALVKHLHSMFAAKAADDYQCSMVVITGISTNTEAGTLNSVVRMLDACYDGNGAFLDSVQKSLDMTVELHLSYNGGSQTAIVEDQHVFAFQTADGWFALV